MSFLHTLRHAKPEKRVSIVTKRYEDNISFFKQEYPEIIDFLDGGRCPYHLNLTPTFFDLVHTSANSLCHSAAGLDYDAEQAGQYDHPSWIDLHNFRLQTDPKFPLHHRPIETLRNRLAEEFSDCHERIVAGKIPVQAETDGNRFTPPAVFLGIFDGLHIDHFLSENAVPALLLVEPDPERFEASLYFVDYTDLQRRFGTLYLAIGNDPGSMAIRNFFFLHRIHARMWARLFISYPFPGSEYFVETIRRYQQAWSDIFFPLDIEYAGLVNGRHNIARSLPVLSSTPRLSEKSCIAIVASGPSLAEDLEWLRANRLRIIIFAVHTAVRVLREKGIIPDFQVNIDTDRPEEIVRALRLYREIPLIADHRVGKLFLDAVETSLLCVERAKPATVDFTVTLEDTHPSTTNLAVSFACACRPSTIILIGCDFGYKSAGQTHVSGSIYSRIDAEGAEPREISPYEGAAAPNFPESQTVYANSFLTYARLAVENAIHRHGEDIRFVNFSDGAGIWGAEAMRSKDFVLPSGFGDKQAEDVRRIRNSFRPAGENVNWRRFDKPAGELSKLFRQETLTALSLEDFTRTKFARSVDAALDIALKKCVSQENDHRLSAYTKLFSDLLSIWTCYMLATSSLDEAETVYRKGRELLEEVFAEISLWESLNADDF